MVKQLIELQKLHPIVGDVRGKGLMLGIELVQPGTKEPLSIADVSDILETIKDFGVLIGRGGRRSNVSVQKNIYYTFLCLFGNTGVFLSQVLRIKPPMCINKEDVDFTVSVLDESLKTYAKTKL